MFSFKKIYYGHWIRFKTGLDVDSDWQGQTVPFCTESSD